LRRDFRDMLLKGLSAGCPLGYALGRFG
jgi:hypothetical protein